MEPMDVAALVAVALVTAMNAIDLYLVQRRVAKLEKAVEEAQDAANHRRSAEDGFRD